MPHKLLIEVETIPEDPHSGHLLPLECVRGEPTKLRLTVTNIGDETFPGGTLTEIRVNYEGVQSPFSSFSEELTVKDLAPDERYTIPEELQFVPMADGLTPIFVRVQSMDEQRFDLYQSADGQPSGNDRWTGVLYTVSRAQTIIIDMLTKLLERLEVRE